MKRKLSALSLIGLVLVGAVVLLSDWSPTGRAVLAQQMREVPPAGGGRLENEPSDQMSDATRQSIQAELAANVEELQRRGELPAARPEVVALAWPVRKAGNVADFSVDAISNYVDQNVLFPNQTQDWNCGTRTYDTAAGYNHKGIDIFTWPFSWKKLDNSSVEVVAAAPGTIIGKSDGNFDRSCSFNNNQWNAVFVRHSDNSVAWYGHMKNGSVTTKAIGDTVVTGEKLGIVGSSGNSTGPHLHFELYNAANQLQDPYQGACNVLNNFSWWAVQEPYRVSRINTLMTHSAGPVFPTCPTTETTNEKIFFKSGEMIYTAAYYRDQSLGQQTQYSIVRPDGTTFQSWVSNSPNTYNASYWYWSWTLPANAPRGAWKFRATFNSVTYDRVFFVNGTVSSDFDGDGKSDESVFRPANGTWYLNRSQAGFTGYQFGVTDDVIAPADFTGDGKTDVAVFRPASGSWFVLKSEDSTFYGQQFGTSGDLPSPGDFDGDGKADVAVFRPSTGYWFQQQSTAGFNAVQFGTNGDVPTLGDFDGDGKTDVGVYRSSNGVWYRLNSQNGSFFGAQFGIAGDKVVPADYTGDGKTDIAIWRPADGTWYIMRSEDGSFYAQQFGIASDLPSPGDYDGDGKADTAVFRPGSGTWFEQRSTSGFAAVQFGTSGDKPGSNAFVY